MNGHPTPPIDELHRALTCAGAINELLTYIFLESEDEITGVKCSTIANALWAVDGLIEQAQGFAASIEVQK